MKLLVFSATEIILLVLAMWSASMTIGMEEVVWTLW